MSVAPLIAASVASGRLPVDLPRMLGACHEQALAYERLFPDGAELTDATCVLCGPLDVSWLALRVLNAAQQAEYERVVASARAEYERVVASARAERDRVVAPARAGYERVVASARAEYERVVAPAWAECDRVVASARAAHNIGCARALLAVLTAPPT